jgi:hypothetical protein
LLALTSERKFFFLNKGDRPQRARVGVILVWAEALLPGAGWLAPLLGL